MGTSAWCEIVITLAKAEQVTVMQILVGETPRESSGCPCNKACSSYGFYLICLSLQTPLRSYWSPSQPDSIAQHLLRLCNIIFAHLPRPYHPCREMPSQATISLSQDVLYGWYVCIFFQRGTPQTKIESTTGHGNIGSDGAMIII